MPALFDPLTLRGVTLRNRIGVSSMCQYSSPDGHATDWHLVHLGSRAVGGAGLVTTEAAAVEPRGRIAPTDLGIWSDAHIDGLARVARFISAEGAVAGIQIAHAGRKGNRTQPWGAALSSNVGKTLTPENGGWQMVAPSAVPFDEASPAPHSMSLAEIHEVTAAFGAAAKRADQAGFDWLEVHAGHGYLIHSFHSPLSNKRGDEYGGSVANRIRFAVGVAKSIRSHWPDRKVLSYRISTTDWVEGGWTVDDSVELALALKSAGVDIIDCSSGGSTLKAQIPVGAGYQVPNGEIIRTRANIPTATVGMITEPAQADEIVRNHRADLVLLARELLRDPYWPLHAAVALGKAPAARAPVQYAMGWLNRAQFNHEPLAPMHRLAGKT